MDNVPIRIKRFAYDIIYYVLWVIEIVLFLRFLLKFLGANPLNGSVDFFYSATAVLENPFSGIFGSPASGGIIFDPSILVAMIAYAITAQILVWFVKIISSD